MTSTDWTWKTSRNHDGSVRLRLRPSELVEVEAFAARALDETWSAADALNSASRKGLDRAARLEPKMVKVIKPILDRAADQAARKFKEHATPLGDDSWAAPSADELLDVPGLVAELKAKLDPVMEAVLQTVVEKVFRDVDPEGLQAAGEYQPPPDTDTSIRFEFDTANPYIAALLDRTAAQITSVAETTREQIRGEMAEAYRRGLSIPQTATRIEMALRKTSRARATLIARTEFVRMVNGGSLAAARMIDDAQGGGTLVKVWLTGQAAPHPRHENYAGLGGQQRDLARPFLVGGFELQHPGDPAGPVAETANCRCSVSYREAPAAA